MSSKLKVLQVIPKLGYGGAETGCYDVAHYLAEKGCQSFLITSGGELLKYVNKKKVKVIRLPVQSKNPLLIIFNFLIISILILIYNINIVHARSRAPAWACFWACALTRKKYVSTFHGTYNFSNYFKKIYNSVMVRSKLIIAGSNFIFKHISDNYQNYLDNKKKLLVIFRGINLEYFNSKNISQKNIEKTYVDWKISRDKFIILMPGRLTKWKGQENFIASLKILSENYNKNNFEAVILGSDQGRNVYKKKLFVLAEKLHIRNKIFFVDHCANMPTAYKIANVVVSASIEPEAFGRVSVEAQALNKPIIASDIGGSKETIINNKSGFLYKSDEPGELAKYLNRIMEMDEKTLDLLGREGRKNVEKKFDVEKMCQTTFTEYQKLFNKIK